jgi:hypothetical protein
MNTEQIAKCGKYDGNRVLAILRTEHQGRVEFIHAMLELLYPLVFSRRHEGYGWQIRNISIFSSKV